MKILFLSLISVLCINFSLLSQESYHRVRVFTPDSRLNELSNLGFEIDHGSRKKDTWIDLEITEDQIEKLDLNNFSHDLLIENVIDFYISRSETIETRSDRDNCNGFSSSYNPTTPQNFHLGSYAGFYTYQEFLDELDEMYLAYPNLITQRAAVDTFLTHENRPLYWLKISDNPNVDENEKEVFYSAVHHAREPVGLSQLIFYMWYILENYNSNAEINYLLNNTELYFIPMLNPDGYIENEVNNSNGGGMHRKNKRNVGSSNPGVDLNRNYDYQWNVSGTSPNVNDDTYAGTHGFSEPETQAIKYFCENHSFEFALNAHSYSNLLLFPFGYATNAFSNDHDYFTAFSSHLVQFSNYTAEKASELYPAAGDSDDWMYDGDLGTKPKIFALTPEIGNSNDGFWPAQSRILPLCKENVFMNLTLAHLPHIYGVTTDQTPNRLVANPGYLNYNLQRLGLENGPITVEIIPISGILSVDPPTVYNLNLMDNISDSVLYLLMSNLNFGDEIKYVIKTDFGLWANHDTITKYYGLGTLVINDNCNTITNWSGLWGNTNEYFVSPNFSITDSPNSNYANNQSSDMVLANTFNLTNSTYAFANFYARWEIETDWDYVEFMISVDNGLNWTPLCGQYTNLGNTNQDLDAPLYDGFQTEWVLEEVDLNAYIGFQDVKFKFRLVSDGFVTEDGFSFDDFKIFADGTTTNIKDENLLNKMTVLPNPTNINFNVNADFIIYKYEIYSQTGQLIKSENTESKNILIDINGMENGLYILKCFNENNQSIHSKVIVQK